MYQCVSCVVYFSGKKHQQYSIDMVHSSTIYIRLYIFNITVSMFVANIIEAKLSTSNGWQLATLIVRGVFCEFLGFGKV